MKAGMKNIPMPTTAEKKNKNHKVPRRSEEDAMLLMDSQLSVAWECVRFYRILS
jgi:hypothetical protein